MFRYVPHLLGVLALGFLAVYLASPATGLYDYEAGAIRTDVVLMLVKAAAVGLGIGAGLRWHRRRAQPA